MKGRTFDTARAIDLRTKLSKCAAPTTAMWSQAEKAKTEPKYSSKGKG